MDDAPFPSAGSKGSDSAAEVLLRAMKANGIDYMFANPGTDFAPMIEGLVHCQRKGADIPKPMVITHENCAVAMAHGYYMVSGKPQAVMVHTNVGTANTLNCLADACRDNVPIFLMAGRNPITEQGVLGSRNGPIHWGQEMFDQAGMLREFVKWDYEMRLPMQAEDVVARALEVMMASPRGSAYLTLPREVLGGAVPDSNKPMTPRAHPSMPHPNPVAMEQLAAMIATAERPMIITSAAGRTRQGMEALARVSERFALPVVSFNARFVCLPSSHPMNLGYQVKPLLSEADLVIVLDCDAPWYPSQESPPAGCRIVQIGDDPAFTRYPMRSFPCDLSITAETVAALTALEAALAEKGVDRNAHLAARRQRLAERHKAMRAQWKAAVDKAASQPTIKLEYLNHCLGQAIGPDAVIVNEYWARQELCPREKAGTFYGSSPAGGLGWGLGAALGAKLALPDKLVVSTCGDGAYMFANPTACHWVGEAHKLPVLTVINNNAVYNAVRRATLGMYEKGVAQQKDDAMTLADLQPSPAFEKLIEASGGYGERVEKPADLPAALARAVKVVREEKRQALLNVIVTL
ncbi:MAG TPA: thiamine pyrophosphate-requiring protein [Stellaceae bacterium]|nr:thiamine pyrophosphate-requiring protein [Stellaceae bacterium]